MNRSYWCSLTITPLLLASPLAHAHSFGNVYTPPIPFWMYAWGASGALLTSFLVFGFFFRRQHEAEDAAKWRLELPPAANALVVAGKLISVFLMMLCIATGLFGEPSPYGNFNMSFFWIVFALGGLYLAALIGNFYASFNPWRILSMQLAKLHPPLVRGFVRYPKSWGYWPAFMIYLGFIWTELFARNTPASLAHLLLGYTTFNLLGAGLLGVHVWYRYIEFFSVIFRLIGGLAPLQWQRLSHQRIELSVQAPLGSAAAPVKRFSLLIVILFLLSSTAFDGLKETVMWHRLFWVDLYHAGLKHYAGINPLASVPQMRAWYLWWNSFWLSASPFVYLLIYTIFIDVSRRVAGSRRASRQLCLDFAGSLLPIALVYHITHYYTLIQAQGVKIIQMASDPFGWGWNLFGTANWLQRSIVPDPNIVWHVQVILIVLGHIASVYIAHKVALRVFDSRAQAIVSQIPMLILMLIFTSLGLWILSLPTIG